MLIEENKVCPCCGSQCQSDALQCGRGRRYFEQREVKSHESRNSHHCNHSEEECDGIEGRLMRQLRTCGRYLHHNGGKKSGQNRILSVLSRHGSMSQRELQETLGVQSGSLSEILSKIESNGYLIRNKSESDRRQTNVSLTDSGKEAAGEMDHCHEKNASDMFCSLTEEEKTELSGLLKKVLDDWEVKRREEGHGCGRHEHRSGHRGREREGGCREGRGGRRGRSEE